MNIEKEFEKVKITNKRLKKRILSTVVGLRKQLAKLYKLEDKTTMKLISIVVAVILLDGYDTKKEIEDVVKKIKTRLLKEIGN